MKIWSFDNGQDYEVRAYFYVIADTVQEAITLFKASPEYPCWQIAEVNMRVTRKDNKTYMLSFSHTTPTQTHYRYEYEIRDLGPPKEGVYSPQFPIPL